MILKLDDNWPKTISEFKFKNEKLATLMIEALRSTMNTLIYDTLPAFTNRSVGEALKAEIEGVSFKGENFIFVRHGPNLKLVKKINR